MHWRSISPTCRRFKKEVMAHIVMAYIVMAYIVIAYKVMAYALKVDQPHLPTF